MVVGLPGWERRCPGPADVSPWRDARRGLFCSPWCRGDTESSLAACWGVGAAAAVGTVLPDTNFRCIMF